MNQRLLRELVILTAIVLSLAGFLSLVAVGAVQVAQTDPTSVTITTTTAQSTTITATMTHYVDSVFAYDEHHDINNNSWYTDYMDLLNH